MLNISSLRFSFFKHIFLQGSKKSSNFAPDFKICVIMKRIMLTLVLAIAAGVWNLNWASGSQISSLCDEWNVWHESFESFGPISFDKVVKYQLTTDTLINGQQYVKLTSDKDSPYLGAMREGNNRDIYYVPAGSTNEFLLYAFNAQVGEVLNDLYLGGFEENGYSGRVEAISDSSPRLFTIRVLYPDGMGAEPGESFSVTWIEGVGSPETPCGLEVVPPSPADVGTYSLLCAYNKGEQVYVSEWGEKYGCVFQYREDFIEGEFVTLNGNIVASFRECSIDGCPTCFGTFMTQDASFYLLTATDTLIMEQLNMLYLGKQYTIKGVWTKCKNTPFIEVNAIYETKDTIPSDTIPLYIKDGPGSSTVEPVDPNLIYATLSKDILSIYAKKDLEINMILYKVPSANHAPALKRTIKATTFTDSISTTLTESGTYTLELTNPAWDYTIVGTFEYQVPQAIENTQANTPSATKILKDGRLFLRYKGQMYNVQGQQVQ